MSSSTDASEREAARVARRVMQGPVPETNVTPSQMVLPAQATRKVSVPDIDRGSALGRALAGRSGGRRLDDSTRSFMESRFHRSFSDVRIHTGELVDAAAQSIRAQAFTVGQDIWFARNRYQPRSYAGRQRLAHELVHTIQQAGGSRGTGAIHRITAEPARVQRLPCQQTNHPPGNLAHELIEDDYITRFPGGRKEFEIPGSGPLGGTGWADLANVFGRTIYEIKTWTGVPAGQNQRDRYIAGANAHCGGVRPWTGGRSYPYTVLPMNATTELVARQYLSMPDMEGIIVYWTRRRRRRRAPQRIQLPAWFWVLLAMIFLVALALALLEPTPAGEVVWVIALVLVLIGTGVLGSSPAMAAASGSGPNPNIPAPPMQIPGGGDLAEELGAIIADHPEVYARIGLSPTALRGGDVRQLYADAVQARARIDAADPDDPMVQQVRAAIRQIRPYVREGIRTARSALPAGASRVLDYVWSF